MALGPRPRCRAGAAAITAAALWQLVWWGKGATVRGSTGETAWCGGASTGETAWDSCGEIAWFAVVVGAWEETVTGGAAAPARMQAQN